MTTELWLILFLFTKHFIIDFPLQTRYQWSNKGTYGHPGGLLHSGFHGVGTLLCLFEYAPIVAVYLALADMFIHYHVDWAKMQINSKLKLAPTTHEEFWWLLGLDQFLHALTYIAIVALVTTH